MKDITFLRTVILISHGKLSHLTYRWKGGTSFTLEQIVSILYPIERKRAKGIAQFIGYFIGLIGFLLLGVAMWYSWVYWLVNHSTWIDTLEASSGEFFIFFWGGVCVVAIVRYAKRVSYHYLMRNEVATNYVRELKKFSDALQETLKYLNSSLEDVLRLHRDDIAAQAVGLMDSMALEIVTAEKSLSDTPVSDVVYEQFEINISKLRERFKIAYTAFEAMSLVAGGYTNFFRRAIKTLEESVAA